VPGHEVAAEGGLRAPRLAAEALDGGAGGRELGVHCPGRKPAFLAIKRPARSYKFPIQNPHTKPIHIGKR
jgi:hypothetical protein